MAKIVKLLLALVVFSLLTACCLPMHASHGSHQQDYDESRENGEQKSNGHCH